MPQFRIQHTTRYVYEDTVRDSANQVMLYPMNDDFQSVLQQTLVITGNPAVHVHEDYYGNKVGTFTCAQPHRGDDYSFAGNSRHTRQELTDRRCSWEQQWQELKSLRHQLAFIDFCHVERFAAISEIEKDGRRRAMRELHCARNSKTFQQIHLREFPVQERHHYR